MSVSVWRDWVTWVFVVALVGYVAAGVAVFAHGAWPGWLFAPIVGWWLVRYVAGPSIDRWIQRRGQQ